MRILHLGKYYHPHNGGMETVLRNIAEGLLDSGDEVAVIAAGPGTLPGGAELAASGGRTGRLFGTPCLGQWFSQPLTWDLVHTLRRAVSDFQPDLVHLHLPNPLGAAAWLAYGALEPGPHPVLAVWHHADMHRQKVGRIALRPLVRACLGRAAGISVSTQALAEVSRELRGMESKVRVIPFGIDQPVVDQAGERATGPFLFVGRLVRYKGLGVLLKALDLVPDARLEIVGTGPREEYLRGLAQELGLGDRVEFLGRLSEPELARHLAGARALVLPSLDAGETFGLVQLEAMATGKAVIASDLPTGVTEVGRAGTTGLLVPPGDVQALGAALKRLQEDPGLARDMGAAGKERYLERFTRDRMITDLRRWYRDLISSASPVV